MYTLADIIHSELSISDDFWVLDKAKIKTEVIKAIEDGKAVIHDGVAYWAEGSGKTGIIQHLPFKKGGMQEIKDAIGASTATMQMTTVVASAVSTGIILAAIIVQTRYLASKLDKIQEVVDRIAKEIETQNIIFYMDKCSDYFGSIETARMLLADRALSEEIKPVAAALLASLASKRNQLLSFIANILTITPTELTSAHFDLIVNFVQKILEVLPFGIHAEYLLSARVEKIRLAEQILFDGKERFQIALDGYHAYLVELKNLWVKGVLPHEQEKSYNAIRARAKEFIDSDLKDILFMSSSQRAALATNCIGIER